MNLSIYHPATLQNCSRRPRLYGPYIRQCRWPSFNLGVLLWQPSLRLQNINTLFFFSFLPV